MAHKGFTPTMTFKSFINNIYFVDIEKKLKANTISSKKWQIIRYMIPYFGKMPVNKISVPHIKNWLEQLKKETLDNGSKLSLSYIQGLHSCLQTILQHAVDNYTLSENKAKQVPKVLTWTHKTSTTILPLEEYQKFSNTAMFQPMYFYIFELLYWTGIKEGELLALLPEDIDFENKTLSITKTHYTQSGENIVTPLSSIKKRRISIPEFLADELSDYIATYKIGKNKRLFPVQKTAINRHAHSFAKHTKIQGVSVNIFRDSHAVMLLNEGFSLSDIAGRLGITCDAAEDRYSQYLNNSQTHITKTLENLKRTINE